MTDNISSFCRKTTMVKHARRSHAPGGGVMGESDDEDDDNNSPTTPNGDMRWGLPNQIGANYWPNNYPQERLFNPVEMPKWDFDGRTSQRHYPEHGARINSLGSNGPQYNPNGNHAQAEMQRRVTYSQFPMHQQRALPAISPVQQHQVHQIDYHTPYQPQQPRTADVHVQPPSLHNSPGSFHSTPSPPGDVDSYTHQSAQAATHALHTSATHGQEQPMAHFQQFSEPQQHGLMHMPAPQPPQQQFQSPPTVTHSMYDQHYVPATSGPPMQVQTTWPEAQGGLTSFPQNSLPHSFPAYNLGGWPNPELKVEEDHMMLPTQRYQNL